MSTFKLVNIKSSEKDKKPQSGQIDYGQIAVNYNEGNERLFIKNSKNVSADISATTYDNIVSFIPEHVVESKIEDAVKPSKEDIEDIKKYTVNTLPISGNPTLDGSHIKLSSSYTISDQEYNALEPASGDTIDTVVGKIHKAIIDNEEVCAAAITKLNTSCGFDEHLVYTPSNPLLTGMLSLNDSCEKLAEEVSNKISDIDFSDAYYLRTKDNWVDVEEVVYPKDVVYTKDEVANVIGEAIPTFKTVGGQVITGSGDIAFKTINKQSIIGEGDITINLDIYEVVTVLPEVSAATENKIYLVPVASGESGETNTYVEYLLVDKGSGEKVFEELGRFKVSVDLSEYAKKSEISDMLTKTEASGTYLSKTDAESTYAKKTDVYTKTETYQKSEVYSKNESDNKYALKFNIDTSMSSSSTNVVQNKVIDAAIKESIKLPSNYSASTLTNAELEPKAGETVQVAVGKLHKAILDNEEVISAALNNLNNSCGFNSTIGYEAGSSILSGATSLVQAIELLAAEIEDLKNRIPQE